MVDNALVTDPVGPPLSGADSFPGLVGSEEVGGRAVIARPLGGKAWADEHAREQTRLRAAG